MSRILEAARPSRLGLDAFLEHYGDVFEHSPWVAENAWKQGFTDQHDDPDVLADCMGNVLKGADIDQQIAVIRAHPDLAESSSRGRANPGFHSRTGWCGARSVLNRRV